MSEHAISLHIPADHRAYSGHFPGRPVLPGVVLLDAALRALAARQGVPAMAAQIRVAKFLSPVSPGEPLVLYCTAPPTGGVRFEIRCPDPAGGEPGVASGVMVFAQAGSS